MDMLDAKPIVDGMKNQKINYDVVLKKLIRQWEKDDNRPTVLIHTCCAPCIVHIHWSLCVSMRMSPYFFQTQIFTQKASI